METNFDPKAKVKQGDLGPAPDGKQPNQAPTNIDFDKHAPRKYESKNYLDLEKGGEYVTKSGKEHVQNPLLEKADKASY